MDEHRRRSALLLSVSLAGVGLRPVFVLRFRLGTCAELAQEGVACPEPSDEPVSPQCMEECRPDGQATRAGHCFHYRAVGQPCEWPMIANLGSSQSGDAALRTVRVKSPRSVAGETPAPQGNSATF